MIRNNNNNNNNNGVGILSVIGIVFIILKILKIIDWSWFYVLSPFIFDFIIWFIIVIFLFYVKLKTNKMFKKGYGKKDA